MTARSRSIIVAVIVAVLCTAPPTWGQVWSVHTVDGPGAGQHSCFALIAGQPAISYYDAVHGDLRYVERDGNHWAHATVDSAGNVGMETSLAELPTGEPAISYFDRTHLDLKYAWRDAGVWHVETVDAGDALGSTGRFSDLVILPGGGPAICYADNHRLKFAWYDGGAWQFEIIDEHVADMSMALQPDGNPAIAYFDVANLDARYAWFDGASWHTELVYGGTIEDEGPVNAGIWIDLTFPDAGLPLVSFHEFVASGEETGLCLSQSGAGGWSTEQRAIGGTPFGGAHTSVAVRPGGLLFIACARDPGEVVQYVEQAGLPWDVGFLVDGSDGDKTSICAGGLGNGQPALCYYDKAERVLKFAFLVDTGDMNCDGAVDLFDIEPFGLALTSPEDYALHYPLCVRDAADCNRDDAVDLFDIDPFVTLLAQE